MYTGYNDLNPKGTIMVRLLTYLKNAFLFYAIKKAWHGIGRFSNRIWYAKFHRN